MIVPKVSLQGVTYLDAHRRADAVDGQPGSFSPRPDKDRSQSLEAEYRRQLSVEREEPRQQDSNATTAYRGLSNGQSRRVSSSSPPPAALQEATLLLASTVAAAPMGVVERTPSIPLATLQDHEAWHRTERDVSSRHRAASIDDGATQQSKRSSPSTVMAQAPQGEDEEREACLPDYLSVRDCRVRGYSIGASNIIRGSKWDKQQTAANKAATNEARQEGSRWFQRFPTITAAAISHNGSHAAFGDESGAVSILEAGRPTPEQRRMFRAKRSMKDPTVAHHGLSSVYSYYRGTACFEAYSSLIDPLNSVEVTPAVSAMCFLPQQGNSTFVLTANEKQPKLFKVFEAYDCPRQPFRAVDMLGKKSIGPLVSSQRTRTANVRLVSKYALDHEYNVNSISASADGSQFYTSDELCVKLWSTENPDTSLNVVTLPRQHSEGFTMSEGDESVRECIRSTHVFPAEPQLLFMCTSAGLIRVFDSRVSLRWGASVGGHQIFANPQRRRWDGKFGVISNALTGGCALSPCGRYIASRDFLSVPMWDVRMVQETPATIGIPAATTARPNNSYVHRWEIHPNVRRHMDPLFESNLMVERFSIAFAQSLTGASSSHQGAVICTGSFANSLYLFDPYTGSKDYIRASDLGHSSATEAGPGVRRDVSDQLSELDKCESEVQLAKERGDEETMVLEREYQLDQVIERLARLTMTSMRRYYVPPPEHTLDALESDRLEIKSTEPPRQIRTDGEDDDDGCRSIDLDEESTISPSVPADDTGLSFESLWGARRIAHVLDTRRPGGGVWVAAGGSVSHLVV